MTHRKLMVAVVALVALWLAAEPAVVPELDRRAGAAEARRVPILFHGHGGVGAVDPDGTNERMLVPDATAADQNTAGELVYVRTTNRVDEWGFNRYDSRLYTADRDGQHERPLGVHGHNPRWSPDGQWIAFDLDLPDRRAGEDRPYRFAVVGRDGTGLTELGAGSEPDWAPDGERLVFVAQDRLWVVPARRDAAATAITPPIEGVAGSHPQWSPDGTMIAFGGHCLGVVHPDGSGLRCTKPAANIKDVVGGWDPTSREIAWYSAGFHQWTTLRWRDPATGTAHAGAGFPSGWANPAGPVRCGQGYWLLGRDGGVFTFGSAAFHGSTGGMRLNQPVLGMSPTATGDGYWLVASDGGVFTFGDASFHGSAGALPLQAPVVGMAATPTGRGYWLVASDGGIFSYGDAGFFGSTGDLRLQARVVGMRPTPSGRGYWLVASDGGVFTFGDAAFHGSTGGMRLAQPVIGMTATSTAGGYTLVARDGGTFAFGDALFPGSAATPGLPAPVVAAAPAPGDSVLLATTTGEVAALGGARFCGSTRSLRLNAPIVGAAVRPE